MGWESGEIAVDETADRLAGTHDRAKITPMDTRAAARRWKETWRAAWEAVDARAIEALYTHDASYASQPFRAPHRGAGAYLAEAFPDESNVRAWFGEPIVDGDRAAISWWATLREGGSDITLAGTSVLRFNDGGLVVAQWDAWNQLDGWREPPADWAG